MTSPLGDKAGKMLKIIDFIKTMVVKLKYLNHQCNTYNQVSVFV